MPNQLPGLRRLIMLPAVVLLAGLLVLAGCGGSTTANTPPAPTATTAPAPTATSAPATTPTAAASPTSSGSGATAKASIEGTSTFGFSPTTMSIKAGTTVTWTNNTQAPHTVSSDSGDPMSFNGSLDSNGSTFSFTFTQPGTYHYHCSVHPYMTATITVTQ